VGWGKRSGRIAFGMFKGYVGQNPARTKNTEREAVRGEKRWEGRRQGTRLSKASKRVRGVKKEPTSLRMKNGI